MPNIRFLGTNDSSSVLSRALGELALLNPPFDASYTAEAFVALTDAHDLVIRLSSALPSDNLSGALVELQKCLSQFHAGNFSVAQTSYSDALAWLCQGGIKWVTCVIRTIGGAEYFCWDFPNPGEQYYSFHGIPYILQTNDELYLIWLLAMPNKIKLRKQPE